MISFNERAKFIDFITTVVIIFGLIISPVYAASLGVSVANEEDPGKYDMYFRNMLRAGYAEKPIVISSSTNASMLISITVDDVFKDWISFDPGNNFTMSTRTFPLKAIVRLPENVPNGLYTGLITIKASQKPLESKEGEFGSQVAAAVALKTAIEVTGEQIVKARVLQITNKNAEEGFPIEFAATIKNEGNVKIKPKIEVKVLDLKTSNILKSLSFDDEEVLPSVTKTIIVKVPPTDLEIGQYWADVKISLAEDVLSEKKLMFEVFEKGTLRITGELVQVWNQPWVFAGDVVKIEAKFKNTGELITSAKFIGEIIKDDRIVKVLESDEIDVKTGEEVILRTYFTPEEAGRYVVRGHVLFSKKVTETKESIINVNLRDGSGVTGAATGAAPLSIPIILGIMTVAVVGVIIYKIFPFKMRKRF